MFLYTSIRYTIHGSSSTLISFSFYICNYGDGKVYGQVNYGDSQAELGLNPFKQFF